MKNREAFPAEFDLARFASSESEIEFDSEFSVVNAAIDSFSVLTEFSNKLRDVKFSEFATLSQKQIDGLDSILEKDIPALMEELPSERDSPETLRAKMSGAPRTANIPIPKTSGKYGNRDDYESNPFGPSQDNKDHYWALQDSAERLASSFEALGPEGGYLSTKKARNVLVKTGLEKDHLRQIWNLSDMDRDGLFDLDEYVVAMFLCDAVIQKGRPIPAELPASVVPPSKRHLVK